LWVIHLLSRRPNLNSTQLKQNLFGPTPYANCLIAVAGSASDPGETIAMALYFFNYSTWTGRPGLYVRLSLLTQTSGVTNPESQLEDLIVTEKFRGSGVAKALFAGLAEVAQQRV
jgi:GNAT superfamily N-acetyltransferase